MSQESLNRAVRATRRTRSLGPDARCSRCGCADPTMLVQPPPPAPRSNAQPPNNPTSSSATGRRSTTSPRPRASAESRAPQKPILCYECLLIQQGKITSEAHHLLGKANDATTTIPAPGNQHRVQSDLQREWPEEVRNNRHRDPLLELAGWCLSLKDHLVCWIERLGHVADWLVTCCHALRDHFGTTTWWISLGVPPLWGELGT